MLNMSNLGLATLAILCFTRLHNNRILTCEMVFKLYVHYDGPPEFSKVFKLSEESQITAADVLQTFTDAFKVRHGNHLSSSKLYLRKERRDAVDPGARVVEALRTGADLHVVLVPASPR